MGLAQCMINCSCYTVLQSDITAVCTKLYMNFFMLTEIDYKMEMQRVLFIVLMVDTSWHMHLLFHVGYVLKCFVTTLYIYSKALMVTYFGKTSWPSSYIGGS